jgi:hypothetical protein
MEVYRTFNHFLKYPPRFNSKRASRAGIAAGPFGTRPRPTQWLGWPSRYWAGSSRMGRTAGLGRACRWTVRTAARRCRHARAGGGGGTARKLNTVVMHVEERGGEEEGLIGWHNGVGARWLAWDHGMGRRRAEPARWQQSRAAAPRLSGERGTEGAAPEPCSAERER